MLTGRENARDTEHQLRALSVLTVYQMKTAQKGLSDGSGFVFVVVFFFLVQCVFLNREAHRQEGKSCFSVVAGINFPVVLLGVKVAQADSVYLRAAGVACTSGVVFQSRISLTASAPTPGVLCFLCHQLTCFHGFN